MYSDAFLYVIERVLGHEGGYVNDPTDPGGETKWGISKRSYPHLDIANLTREEAIQIYWDDFWCAGKLDHYPIHKALAFQAMDAAVNHGCKRAVKLVQVAAGVTPDGAVGPATVAAVKALSLDDMLLLFMAARIDFWTGCSNWPSAGKGWARRAAANLRFAAKDNEN